MTELLPPQTLLHPERTRIETHRLSKGAPELLQEELQVDWFHVIGLPVWIAAVALSINLEMRPDPMFRLQQLHLSRRALAPVFEGHDLRPRFHWLMDMQ